MQKVKSANILLVHEEMRLTELSARKGAFEILDENSMP